MEGIGHTHNVREQAVGYDAVGQPNPVNPQHGRRWWPTLESKVTLGLIIIAASIVLAAAINGTFMRNQPTDLVKSDQYQAVFLSNGQVYFGKITNITRDLFVLQEIFYLQVDQQIQPDQEQENNEESEPQIRLTKLGQELHGPEDQMFISSNEVVFWENLKDDSQVVRGIKQSQTSGNSSQPTPVENSEPTTPGNPVPDEDSPEATPENTP